MHSANSKKETDKYVFVRLGPYLLIGDGVGHVSWVDHSWNPTQERHSSIYQPEVVFLILQQLFKFH